jgi:hypothetical protein
MPASRLAPRRPLRARGGPPRAAPGSAPRPAGPLRRGVWADRGMKKIGAGKQRRGLRLDCALPYRSLRIARHTLSTRTRHCSNCGGMS